MRLAPWLVLALLGLLAGCAQAPRLELRAPVVLLGEVHDNANQHALRLEAFKALLATGARPALLMEQFDRSQQTIIDSQRQGTADSLINAAKTGSGWLWDFYRPFIALALAHGLPIIAANVSRDEARAIMRSGLAEAGFDPAVPPDIAATAAADIEASHCGMLDASTAQRMALAQSARDQFMARMVEAHAARGVVLLAGNGHVRSDTGVPRWLSPGTRARSESIGLLEQGDAPADLFDRVVLTARQARPDPCEAFGKPKSTSAPAQSRTQ